MSILNSPRHSLRRQPIRFAALTTIALIMLSACGASPDGATASFKPKHKVPESTAATSLPAAEKGVGTIKVASLPIPHNAQFIALPYFAKRYGLDVEWQSFQRYSDTQLAVSRGDVVMAAAGYHTISLDTAPTDTKIVAGGNSGGQALVLRPGLKVSDWSGLEGLKIGVAPNSGPDIQFQLSSREAGFDPNSIVRTNFTTIGPATLTALHRKDIDGMLCWEVVCAQAVDDGSGAYATIDIGANETHNANTLALSNAKWLEKYPNAATRLVRAYVDAVTYFKAHPDDLVALMVKQTGATAKVVKHSLSSITLEWRLYRSRALATARAYAALGVSKKDMSAEVEKYLDYSFLENATGLPESGVGG